MHSVVHTNWNIFRKIWRAQWRYAIIEFYAVCEAVFWMKDSSDQVTVYIINPNWIPEW